MVRRKVSTIMDEALFRRAKSVAAAEGRPLSAVLEDALILYLDGPRGVPRAAPSSVAESWGVFALPSKVVRQVLEDEDEYPVD